MAAAASPTPSCPLPAREFVEDRRRRERAAQLLPPRPATYGIALSGGGCRSLSCCSGLLRGLNAEGILTVASHVSGVSGGGWATMVYTYAQGLTRDEVLIQPRAFIPPADLTLDFLNAAPPDTSMLKTATTKALPRFLLCLPCSLVSNVLRMVCLVPGPSTLLALDWVRATPRWAFATM